MASAVESVIECQICRLTFTEPLALSCEHSFCQSCVDRITKSGNIKCPVCSKITLRRDVKPDFRLVQFLDALAEKVQDLTKAKPSAVELNNILCELCEEKCISHYCENCDKWICKSCRMVHAKITDTIKHAIISFKEKNSGIINRFSPVIQALREKLQQNEIHVADLDKRIRDNEALKEQTLSCSKNIREEFISEINTFFDGIDSEMHKLINTERDVLQYEKTEYEHECQSLRNKVKQLDKLLEQYNVELLKNGAALLKEAQEYVQKLQTPTLNNTNAVSMDLVKLSDLNLNDIVILKKVSVSRLTIEKSSRTTESTVNLPQQQFRVSATEGLWTYQKSIDVPGSLPSVRVIDGFLYCCHRDGVTVYNNQLHVMQSMIKEASTYFRDIVCMSGDRFVVSSDRGLKVYDRSGTRLNVINDMDITSVQLHGGKLYATESITHTIHVYNPEGWTKQGSIIIPCKCNVQYTTVTMSVSDGGIKVCCNHSRTILTMSLLGDVRHEFGEQGQGAGQFHKPYLCDADGDGILIADKNNSRLQHCDARGQWHVLKFQSALIGNPHSAALWDGRLYVSTWNRANGLVGKLSFYTM